MLQNFSNFYFYPKATPTTSRLSKTIQWNPDRSFYRPLRVLLSFGVESWLLDIFINDLNFLYNPTTMAWV